MQNFTFHNPVKILFGRGQIRALATEIPPAARILLTYGGGSIRSNGVYDQIQQALKGRVLFEFGGIEPNPTLETLSRAVALARAEGIDFLLAVGGGSVLDGTKFIAAAIPFAGDPWQIVASRAPVTQAIAMGTVLTLPATGSEMNGTAVITRGATREKLYFSSPLVMPRFSILDPQTTFSLSERQVGNGVADAFTHVVEQYLTYPVNAPLQDRMAEAILLTLIEEGPKTLAQPEDYEARANLMWCATLALNGLIGAGVPQDWTTHAIGHELTALHGIDHGRTLAIVLPAVLQHQRKCKRAKLLQYAERIWGLSAGDEEARIDGAIEKTRAFFESVGVPTRLTDYSISAETIPVVVERLAGRGPVALGEHQDIDAAAVGRILALSL